MFSVKIWWLEIMFNDVLDEKKKHFCHKKFSLSKSQKSNFSKGVNPCFWSKNITFFLYLFSVKIRLEKLFNIFLDRKETFFSHRNLIFESPRKLNFSKGVNPFFWSKNVFPYLFSVKVWLKIMIISKIQLLVYYQCCVQIGWATTRLYVIAHW